MIAYFRRYRPLVAVMAPTCKPFGSWGRFNYTQHYDGWLRGYEQAAPHGRFCGKIEKGKMKKTHLNMQGTTNISAAAGRHDEAKVQGGHRGNGLSKVPGAYAGRSVQVKLLIQHGVELLFG